MGALIEQPINTLFQGVTRQPDTVRLPGQVEEAENALLSVVTGGFSNRAGTKHIKELTDIASGEDVFVYGYSRDETEQYIIVIRDGDILVYDLDGNKKTVNVSDQTRTLVEDGDSTSTGALSATEIAYPSSESQITLTASGIAGGLEFDVEGSDTGDFAGEETTLSSFTADGDDTVSIKPFIRVNVTSAGTGTFSLTGEFNDFTYLLVDAPHEDFAAVTIADYTLIANKTVVTSMEGAGSDTIHGPVKTFSDLPKEGETVPSYLTGLAAGSTWADSDIDNGDIWKVEPSDGGRFGYFFVKVDKTSGDVWEWNETADPNHDNDFDATTMPHKLVREADGTFTFSNVDWESREVGDPTVTPDPDFVGVALNDIVFHSDRLVMIADEAAYHSQSGDYFNFWPDKATEVLDSDPFGRAASGNEINIIRFAIPFRKVLFLTAAKTQHEISSFEGFTPRNAKIEPTTSYEVSSKCRPATVGNEVYLASKTGSSAQLFEYFFAEGSTPKTAGNVTKHVEGYIPQPLVQLIGDTASGTILTLSDDERNSLYVYKLYWDGEEKAQSAWSRWKFGDDTTDAHIHGGVLIDGDVYLVIRRNGDNFLEQLLLHDERGDDTDYTITNSDGTIWPVILDRRHLVTGSYDSGNDETTWTLDYDHDDNVDCILTDDFSSAGRKVSITFPSDNTIKAPGDFSGGNAIIGKPITMTVEPSKQYVREGQGGEGRTITNGRLQLKVFALNYQDTGFFKVKITPKSRSAKTWVFNGRILGDASNKIGETPIISTGTFKTRPNSRGDTCKIEIINDSHVPCTITSAWWIGFFNEITRQE